VIHGRKGSGKLNSEGLGLKKGASEPESLPLKEGAAKSAAAYGKVLWSD
jgi:hypothetical protein